MDSETIPTRIWFFSYAFPSMNMYKHTRQALKIALSVLLLSFLSMVFGVIGKIYLFSVMANLPGVLFPVVVYQALTKTLWGKEIIKVQCLYGSLYVITFLIVDAILLAYTVTNYRYCYGDWTGSCSSHRGSTTIDLDCTTSRDVITFVSCSGKNRAVMILCCYCLQLVSTLMAGPYLYACQMLKSVMPTTFTDLGEGQISEEQEIQQRTSKSLVIRGNQIDGSDFSDATLGVAAAEDDSSQMLSDPMSESRGILLSRNRIPAHVEIPNL